MKDFLFALGVPGLMVLLLATGNQGESAAPDVSLQQQIDNAQPGDTLIIDGGVYNEHIVIDKPLTLTGVNDPAIDGGGEGDVVTITADDVTFSRFTVRNGGRAISQEPAAIKVVDALAPTIKHNRIENSRFGIHVTGSRQVVVDGNEIDLGDVQIEERSHGIYFWEVTEGAVHDNAITRAGDGIHFEFSEDNDVLYNTVNASRYALHFMYSENNRIVKNRFTNNLSGAVLMFSRNLLLKDNDLSENRKGATGAGILLKDVDDIFVEGNTIIRNRYGLTAEGSPQEIGASATFVRNLFALNDTGVGLFSSAPITFVENSMIENIVQVEAQGGQLGSSVLTEAHNVDQIAGVEDAGSALPPGSRTAIWTTDGRGNYWSDYNGYDADDDGIGDQPYQPKPAFASALEENPTLRLFQFTLANEAIEMASDMLPVYRYSPVMEDGSPLMSPVGPALPAEEGVNGDLLLVSVLLLGLSAAVMQVALDFDPLGAAWRSGKRFAGAFRGETP